jgi:hypothetical protein
MNAPQITASPTTDGIHTTPCPTCGKPVYLALKLRCSPCQTEWWAPREIWARVVRTPYGDLLDGVTVSNRAADYGTPDEIATAIRALREEWCARGWLLREAKDAAGPRLNRQPDETPRAYSRRYYRDMTEPERERVDPIGRYETDRRDLDTMRRELQRGVLPWAMHSADWVPDIVHRLHERYVAALQVAMAAVEERIRETPIDDDAWASELARRDELDAYFARFKRIV